MARTGGTTRERTQIREIGYGAAEGQPESGNTWEATEPGPVQQRYPLYDYLVWSDGFRTSRGGIAPRERSASRDRSAADLQEKVETEKHR
jgi:hypothetical protein